jgi:hypothetical protein
VDGAATIYENSCSWRQIKFELLELSQRHRLNPSVLRFARFGEPLSMRVLAVLVADFCSAIVPQKVRRSSRGDPVEITAPS